jgi:uncharacterized Tic20 family protein
MSETPQPPPSNTPPPPPPGDAAPGGPAPAAGPTPAQPVNYASPSTGVYPEPYTGPAPVGDDKTMGLLAHVLGIVTWFIGPLVIWLIKKDQSPFVADQAKEALNWQITMTIAMVASGIMICIGIGAVLAPVVSVVNLVFCILAAVEVNKGVAYRYPFSLRLVK